MDAAVRVEGLAELRKALRQIEDPTQLSGFRAGLKRAADIVAQEAKSRVPVGTGRARASVRATAGGNRAFVVGGKKSVPYYAFLDFGSRHPVQGNPRAVGPWKGSGTGPKGGRFIYPALQAKERQVADAVGDAVDKAIRKAGF